MSFWSNKKWKARGPKEGVVDPWFDDNLKEADYNLSVGKEYFTNSDDGASAIPLENGEGFSIGLGQFVFILTDEKICIPKNAIGFISARASTKFRGLVNVSGFQVNPGFNGNFIFAMFNAGPMTIHLRRGDQVFSLWIADLEGDSDLSGDMKGNIPSELSEIPSDVLNRISGKALTAYQVKEQLDSQNKKLSNLESQLAATKDRFAYLATVFAVIIVVVLLVFGPEIRNRVFGLPIPPPAEAVKGD